MYNYSKLLGKIKEKCGTQSVFAKKMNLSERTISQKLSNKVDFSQGEILKAANILDITKSEIETYFFATYVQNIEHF